MVAAPAPPIPSPASSSASPCRPPCYRRSWESRGAGREPRFGQLLSLEPVTPGVASRPFPRGLCPWCSAAVGGCDAVCSPLPLALCLASCRTMQRETEARESPAVPAGADSCSYRGSSSVIPADGVTGRGTNAAAGACARTRSSCSGSLRSPCLPATTMAPPHSGRELGGLRGTGGLQTGKMLCCQDRGAGGWHRGPSTSRPRRCVCFGSCSAVTAHPWRDH